VVHYCVFFDEIISKMLHCETPDILKLFCYMVWPSWVCIKSLPVSVYA